jgi:hypothetical protein
VVVWRGDPGEADGRHLVEWTVDEDLDWGRNAVPAAATGPELRQDGDRVVMTGRLDLADADVPADAADAADAAEGVACLRMGEWLVLFDLAAPVPAEADGSWVRISVGSEHVAVYPYSL